MTTSHSRSRRDFLRAAASSCLAGIGGGALYGQFGLVNSALAASCPGYSAVSDYKALVCVYLAGGNDSFNLLIPSDAARYAVYNTARNGTAPNGLAIARGSLLPLAVRNAAAGESYGLHPNCREMGALFNANKGAFIVNVGTLRQPTTKNQYLTPGYPLPPLLFSHIDQQGQWQYGQPTSHGTTGWGGLAADRLAVLNPGAPLPMSISLSGSNRFQTGVQVQPYSVASSGVVGPVGYYGASGAAAGNAIAQMLANTYPDPLTRSYNAVLNNALDYASTLSTALAGGPALNTPFPANNPLADALKMIARIISVRGALKVKRQIFFVTMSGFDTHHNQLADQPVLFSQLSQALGAFYQCTANDLGIADSITTFTQSEFARTLNSNDSGTDHAWGGIQFVMGGAVRGGKLYGAPGASGTLFPNQTLNGPDCLARGQMIPTVSCDQYSATLASWLGMQSCDIATVFPYLKNFSSANLGFV